MFGALIEKLQRNIQKELPGFEAQIKMSSMKRLMRIALTKINGSKESSVLLLLYPSENTSKIVLIKRPEYKGVHGGQICFPGGKKEAQDKTNIDTALREAKEEIGININDVKIIGNLTDLYIPPSNYLVHPVIGYLDYKPIFKAEESEVEKILEVDISNLINPVIKETVVFRKLGIKLKAPYYDINNSVVWGATAMIMSEFIELMNS